MASLIESVPSHHAGTDTIATHPMSEHCCGALHLAAFLSNRLYEFLDHLSIKSPVLEGITLATASHHYLSSISLLAPSGCSLLQAVKDILCRTA